MFPKKRESWDVEETKYFLRLIKERQVMKNLDSKKFRADDIFKCLEELMAEKGYKKTWKQMQTRFKTLRHQYNDIRRKMSKSGSGNCLSSFPYADEMADLLDCRPISTQENIDSSLVETVNENSENSNNWVYEDNPDPRDGSIPGCSSDCNSSISEQFSYADDSSIASSASTQVMKKKPRNKSFGNMMKYADKLKENYEESQDKIMRETRDYIKNVIESEQKMQKELIDNMMENQRNILKDTTNQLLAGLQDIFANRNQDVCLKPTISSQSFNNFSPFSPVNSYIESQIRYSSNTLSETSHSSNNLPKVLVNLKRPFPVTDINEQHLTEKLPKINPKQLTSISSNNIKSTNTKSINSKDLEKHE